MLDPDPYLINPDLQPGLKLHMLDFSYEDDIKIKNKHDAGISRTLYLSTGPSGGLPNLVGLSL
jgi:hypothetical protein